jgi:hypothetical protein
MFIEDLKRKIRGSFGVRIFLAFSVATLTVASVFTIVVLLHEVRGVSENLRREGRALAGLLAYSSKTAVFAENRAALDELVKGIMTQGNVKSVSIFTAEDNAQLGEWRRNIKASGAKVALDREIINKLKAGSPVEIIDHKDTIDCCSPVELEIAATEGEALYFDEASSSTKKSVIGYLTVTMDKSVLKKELRTIVFRSLGLVAAFLLAGAVLVIILLRRVTRPLTVLEEKVRLFGLGETVEKATVESEDEIGRLAIAFNAMADNLEMRETEKKLLEESLRNSQKMEAVGTLARGIAHDFNNILTTVQGSAYMLARKLEADSSLKQYTEQITNSLDKAKKLIQGLITFSRTQVINPCPVNVVDLITNLKTVLTGITGENIQLKISVPERPLMIMADSLQIEQVLMNLCSNAHDAMPDGGVLEVRAEALTIEEPGAPEYPLPAQGEFVLITLSDTGLGMDDETRGRIFEPFFTTKEVGKGTGLGLAITYGIIEQHKGYIIVSTEKGEGTMFRIFLPSIQINTDEAADTCGCERR